MRNLIRVIPLVVLVLISVDFTFAEEIPSETEQLINKATLMAKMGHYEDALRFMDSALEIEPNNVEALNDKGWILLQDEKPEEASIWFDKALEIDPNFELAKENKELVEKDVNEEKSPFERTIGIAIEVSLIGATFGIILLITRLRKKIRHSKNRGTYSANGKKITDALPEGYSAGGKDRSEIEKNHSVKEKKKLWKYELSMVPLGMAALFAGIFGALLAYDFSTKGSTTMSEGLIPFTIICAIISPIGLYFVIKKYRTLEQEQPSGLTKLYFSGRSKKQCTICEKHPVSKKYHIESEHKMKNVNVKDYFIDCGCDICASYNSSDG